MVRVVGDKISPPEWGTLPVEAYMIKNWDYKSTEQVKEQRLRLISDFLQLDNIPREYYDKEHPDFRLPNQDEVNDILLNWRPNNVRKLASHIWERNNCFPFLLRAWYEPGAESAAKMADWINVVKKVNRENDITIIDGNELFIFPQDEYTRADDPNYWRTIYAQLPELAGPEIIRNGSQPATRWEGIPPWHPNLVERFKEDLAYNKKQNPRLWKKDPQYMIESCAIHIQHACTFHPIILLDKEAFGTGSALLMYMDNHSNVIRKLRLPLNEFTLYGIADDWFERKVSTWLWQDSEVGDMWKSTGQMGQAVYQLTAEDMADPAGEYFESEGQYHFIPNEVTVAQPASTGETASVRAPTGQASTGQTASGRTITRLSAGQASTRSPTRTNPLSPIRSSFGQTTAVNRRDTIRDRRLGSFLARQGATAAQEFAFARLDAFQESLAIDIITMTRQLSATGEGSAASVE